MTCRVRHPGALLATALGAWLLLTMTVLAQEGTILTLNCRPGASAPKRRAAITDLAPGGNCLACSARASESAG